MFCLFAVALITIRRGIGWIGGASIIGWRVRIRRRFLSPILLLDPAVRSGHRSNSAQRVSGGGDGCFVVQFDLSFQVLEVGTHLQNTQCSEKLLNDVLKKQYVFTVFTIIIIINVTKVRRKNFQWWDLEPRCLFEFWNVSQLSNFKNAIYGDGFFTCLTLPKQHLAISISTSPCSSG
jgi:hypothetical protein